MTDYFKAVGDQSHLSQGLFFKPSEKSAAVRHI